MYNKRFKENKEYYTPSYEKRLKTHIEEKKSIVEKAMLFIHEDKKYFFDVSTNIQLLAEKLDKKVTVVTHSLDNLQILSKRKEVVVHSLGGCFNKENRFFYKNDYTSHFQDIEFDAAFLGAAAIMEDGIYYADEEDAKIKQEIIKKSKKVILLAEHQKYRKSAYYKGLELNQIDIIIVDPITTTTFVDIIKSQNIRLDPRSLIVI